MLKQLRELLQGLHFIMIPLCLPKCVYRSGKTAEEEWCRMVSLTFQVLRKFYFTIVIILIVWAMCRADDWFILYKLHGIIVNVNTVYEASFFFVRPLYFILKICLRMSIFYLLLLRWFGIWNLDSCMVYGLVFWAVLPGCCPSVSPHLACVCPCRFCFCSTTIFPPHSVEKYRFNPCDSEKSTWKNRIIWESQKIQFLPWKKCSKLSALCILQTHKCCWVLILSLYQWKFSLYQLILVINTQSHEFWQLSV